MQNVHGRGEGEVSGTLCFRKTPLHPAVGGSVRNLRCEAGGENDRSDIGPSHVGLGLIVKLGLSSKGNK